MASCTEECLCSESIPSKSLFSYIDMKNVTVINEKVKHSCSAILNKSSSLRLKDLKVYSKDSKGLVIKIPFLCKVSVNKIEISTSFKNLEVFTNNQYVTLAYKPKIPEEYSLPGHDHIVPVNLPSYKHKSVDTLTLRLKSLNEIGYLNYLCICGIVTGSLPKAVNVSYEVYPLPEDIKSMRTEEDNININK